MRLSLAALLLCAPAFSQSYVETFDGGTNASAWSWNSPCDQTAQDNGEWVFQQLCLDTFAVQPRTQSPLFCGDWRARDVRHFGVDLRTYHVNFPFQRELHLILESGGDAVFLGHGEMDGVPQISEGWKSLDFVIDPSSPTLPAGWEVLGGTGTPDQIWNSVITNVTQVRLFYGYPFDFFIFDQWFTGMDNVRVLEEMGSTYCSSNPNSTGTDSKMNVVGLNTVADDMVYLSAYDMPLQQFGYFLTSQTQGFTMFPGGSDGNLCLGGQIKRFNELIQHTGETGRFSIQVPLAFPPITAGSSWNFQAWHRDIGGSTNFTDAETVTFN